MEILSLHKGSTVYRNSLKFSMGKLLGFTLAEVLLVIGIIGIVAQMTIPTLIHSVDNNVNYNLMIKSYSSLKQAFTNYANDNACLDDFSLCESFMLSDPSGDFWTSLMPYFKITKYCGYNGGCFASSYKKLNSSQGVIPSTAISICSAAILADGSIVGLTSGPLILVDVNGQKGPNQAGRDLFYFIMDSQKRILPFNNGGLSDPLVMCNPATATGMLSLTKPMYCAYRAILEGGIKY